MTLAPSRYELLNRIAVGGMAEVFRAKALGAHGFEKMLAIKKILPDLAKDPEFEERFIAEAKLAVGLSHANVVQVMDFGRFAGTLFIAMELVDGLDLAALIAHYKSRGKKIPIPAAFHISIELIRGLAFAHEHEVVHRDISPSNVLLSKAGEVKIADFGIAVAMRQESSSNKGRVMGKWRYMSPEQTQAATLTSSSDLFSAAAVIFEVFSGRKLFLGKTSKEITENIHTMPIPKLAELRVGVPDAVDEVLAMMLKRDVAKRSAGGITVMKALTEASYKSSIVATALDVADAVSEALKGKEEDAQASAGASVASPSTANGGLDDLIREQLASNLGPGKIERKTAVRSEGVEYANTQLPAAVPLDLDGNTVDGGTMVKSGVDDNGVTLWRLENQTIAAAPNALRSAEESSAEESSGHADEVVLQPVDERAGRYVELNPNYSGLRKGVVLSGIVFTTLLAILLYVTLRRPAVSVSQLVSHADAGRLEVEVADNERLDLRSTPPGAQVVINGKRYTDLTPFSIQVPIDEEYRIHFSLEGYQPFAVTVDVEEGAPVVVNPILSALTAKTGAIHVITKPTGAQIFLDGELLGESPLVLDSVAIGKSRKLVLKLKDHKPLAMDVDIASDAPLKIVETLKSTTVYGSINIGVRKGWAEVREKGKLKGHHAPGKFRLSVGKHKLVLSNPLSGKSKTVVVEVFANRVETYTYALQGP